MKKFKLILTSVFFVIALVLFFCRSDISLRPWTETEPLVSVSYVSGNAHAFAAIADGTRTVAVIDYDGELIYRVRAGGSRADAAASGGRIPR